MGWVGADREGRGTGVGRRGAAGAGAGLPAGARVVTPDDTSPNRIFDRGSAVREGRGRSSQACGKASRGFFPKFRLGAGPRWGRRRLGVDRWWEGTGLPRRVAPVRPERRAGPPREETIAGAVARERVDLGRGGVVGRWG